MFLNVNNIKIIIIIMSNQTTQKRPVKQPYSNQQDPDYRQRHQKSQSVPVQKSSRQNPQQLSQKQKLIDQNIKLKTQIYDLSKKLDEIMDKQQNRKNKYQINQQDDEEDYKGKKGQLKKQQLELMSLKNKIHTIKRQLQNSYNNRALLARQDQLKYLTNQLQNLQQQKKNLLKIKKQQTKVLKQAKSEEQYEQKIQQLKKQLNNLREQAKTLNEKLLQSQKIIRKNHQQYIVKQTKVRQLQQKLLTAQVKNKKKKIIQSVTPQMVEQLQDQVNQLEQQRKQTQKIWHYKLTAIDSELREKKMEEQRKLMLLKQKQKQLKLNQLRIKQLRKLIKWNMMQQNEQAGNQLDNDLAQFRNRRNIKYRQE